MGRIVNIVSTNKVIISVYFLSSYNCATTPRFVICFDRKIFLWWSLIKLLKFNIICSVSFPWQILYSFFCSTLIPDCPPKCATGRCDKNTGECECNARFYGPRCDNGWCIVNFQFFFLNVYTIMIPSSLIQHTHTSYKNFASSYYKSHFPLI